MAVKKQKEILNITKEEASLLLKSLRDVFDKVLIVDPEKKKIWDINNKGVFEPVMTCYKIWNYKKPCEYCVPFDTFKHLKTIENNSVFNGVDYHINCKPIMIDNRLFIFEIIDKRNNEGVDDKITIEERKRDAEIIEILASEYSSVYYIDLDTDELNPYTMNAETESEFGQIFNSGITYSEAFNLYVDKLIYEDDKNTMLKSGSIENIKKQLKNQKTFVTQYRSSDNRYSEMKFVKVGGDNDEPKAVALGFADRDDEIRARQRAEIEQQRNNEIIEILASEYSSVYYIDLITGELTPYSMNEETENQFGMLFKEMSYSEAFRVYVDSLIYSEDKTMMLKAGSVGNIMKELRHKKTFITTYRSDNNGDPHYCEMKFVKVGDDEGTPKAVALGFADKDEELREKIEQNEITKRNTEIIEILASEYSSVYYIDLITDKLTPYTMNEETENQFGLLFKEMSYSEAYRVYVDNMIYEKDKEMMLKAGSIYNILEELHDKKTFITTYRSDNNGDPHYCEMKFVKVGDDDNPQAVALGFADKDEEKRKQIEERIEREKNYEIIEILASEYSSVYRIDLDTDELTTYTMNDRTKEYFENAFIDDITYSKAFGMYVDKAVAPDSKELMLAAGSIDNIREQLKNQKTFITTYLNDENKYSEMKFVKVGSDNEKPKAVALGFSEVDEAYRKELENKQREEFINGLADDYEAVFHVDLDENTIETIRVSDAYLMRNPSLESHMSYPAYVKAVASNIVEDDREGFVNALSPEYINREFKDKEAFFHNYSIMRDGDVTYYQLKVIHTGDWTTDHNYLIGVHNMDELTKAQVAQEEVLEEAREMAESASVAKTTFLFNMSHDIRTPMNAIIGFNNMARKHINNKEKLKDCLDKVDLSSQHLLSIINDVLDMARIESGKVNIQESKVSIKESANHLFDIVKESVSGKKLKFVIDFSDIKHDCVYADELRVNRVMMNVASNAIKYTNFGGTICYTINEVDSKIPGYASFNFIIEDTGIGMSKDFLKHIYEAFTRETSSTISGIQGTGLGMAITKELVELMNGTIDIDSELNKGTKVTLHFDFRIAEEDSKENDVIKETEIQNLKGKTVLLVEDNELNMEIAHDIIDEFGIIVEEANDGTVAVDKCKAGNHYDAILMDIQMPIMNGYDATRAIREFDKDIPIIAMTANAFDEDKKKTIEAGMNSHLAKPINVGELISTLVKYIK